MLALMCVAMLWGDRRDSALADWGRGDGQKLRRAWGCTHDQTPCAATLDHVRRQWDAPVVEAPLGAWAESVLTAQPPVPGEPEAMAMDGKTLRGSHQQGAPATHLLAVLRHRLGLTLWPQAVADNTHAIPVLADGLRALVVEGRVITVEALLTQRAIAERIVPGGGDDVRLVKGHQPPRQPDIQLGFQEAHAWAETVTTAAMVDSGHGRREPRRLTTRSALVGYRAWPGLAQVFPRERSVTMKPPREQRHDVVY